MKKYKRSQYYCMQKMWLIFCAISVIQFFLLPGYSTAQQSHSLKGTVTDTRGVPLPGVTIRLDGTHLGVASDNEGKFTLNLPQLKGVVVCSSVGYRTVKVNFVTASPLVIKMEEEVSELDEVQVIAYGTQTKREMTGAMSVVKAAEIKDVPSPSVANLLQGRVSGMSVVNSTGAPGGGGTNITIRGYNSLSIENGRRGSEPLWVIDGVPMFAFTSPETGLNTLAEIDPADIETLQVLKDAQSSSIYGSRAANGVILVTTKKGRLNQKSRFSVNLSHTFSIKTFLPEQTGGNAERRLRLEALRNYATAYYDKETNTYRYPESWDEALENRAVFGYFYGNGRGMGIAALQDSLNPYYNRSSNLMGYYFRPTRVTDANLQLSGGAERIAYNVGLGYYTEKGTLRNTGFNRIKLLSNLYLKPFPKAESNLRFYLARTGRDRSSRGNDMFNHVSEGDLEKIPSLIMEGTSLQDFKGDEAFDRIKEKNESYRLRSSFDLQYDIVPGLKLKSSLAVDYTQQNLHIFKPLELDEYHETFNSEQINRNLMWINENTLNYNGTFGSHSVDLLGGISFQEETANTLMGYGKGNINQIHIIGNGPAYNQNEDRELKNVQSDMTDIASVGVFFRGDYNYRKKYLFSTTFRWDASSTFGKNHRWGMFPSFAVGYAFSEENLMKRLEWLSYGKIRASWGKSGRRFESPYLAYGVLQLSNQNYNGNQTITPDWTSGLLNNKLSWEETRQWDLGLDMDFLEHRIGLTFDWYRRYTDKLLTKVPVSDSPFAFQWRNAYGICNSGIEFQIKADIIRNEKLTWNVTFNIARNWNKLVKSNDGQDFQNTRLLNNISIIGKSLNQILAFDDRGYYNSQEEVPYVFVNGRKQYLGNTKQHYRPGDRILYDADGDGTILSRYPNQDDRKVCGSPLPEAQGGIISNLTWKGFDVNLLFNYMIGRHILNAAKSASIGTVIQSDPGKMLLPVFDDLDKVSFWQQPGDHADLPMNRAETGLNNFATNLASNVEKVNFLRLKTLVIGYTLPESVRKAVGFNCRVFVSGENLFTLTNYSGTDPESVDVTTGIDYYNNYPLSKRITVGLTLNF